MLNFAGRFLQTLLTLAVAATMVNRKNPERFAANKIGTDNQYHGTLSLNCVKSSVKFCIKIKKSGQ